MKKLLKFYPNKPYKINFENKDDDTSRISDIIETMRSDQRLKILYQGVFDKDRKLDEFAKTIENESDKFCLYIRENKINIVKNFVKISPYSIYTIYNITESFENNKRSRYWITTIFSSKSW